jgi:hypothetical protein
MATLLTVLAALAALIPVLVKIWNNRIDTSRKATDAIIKRDIDELESGMSRISGLSKTDKPVS